MARTVAGSIAAAMEPLTAVLGGEAEISAAAISALVQAALAAAAADDTGSDIRRSQH